MSGARPPSVADTATSPFTAPADWGSVIDPNASDVPYSNVYVAAVPRGLTVPASVALVVPIALAGPADTAGAAAGCEGRRSSKRRTYASPLGAVVRNAPGVASPATNVAPVMSTPPPGASATPATSAPVPE